MTDSSPASTSQSELHRFVHSPDESADANRFWSSDYVKEMRQTLGPDACRKLAIFELPEGFLLSVVVPVFNESGTVAAVVERLRQTGLPLQMILVDDGSEDGTLEAMRGLEPAADLTVVAHPKNRGKGAAIRTGMGHATGDIVVIQDADREYDPSDFRYLLQPLLTGEADVAYGTRYGHYDRQLSPWWHQSVNGFITLLASIAIGIRLSDVETCYKMVPRKHLVTILEDLREERFGIEIELTAKLARQNLRFTERPIRYQHRWYDEGKKIGWKDGVRALWCIFTYGLLRR
ncbi:MAG: glycosyltransferase family 2 protein [Planctomycetota bacterium]